MRGVLTVNVAKAQSFAAVPSRRLSESVHTGLRSIQTKRSVACCPFVQWVSCLSAVRIPNALPDTVFAVIRSEFKPINTVRLRTYDKTENMHAQSKTDYTHNIIVICVLDQMFYRLMLLV